MNPEITTIAVADGCQPSAYEVLGVELPAQATQEHGQRAMCLTSAPACYDGFGTLTVSVPRPGLRLVAIDPQNLAWQVLRYNSGMHAWGAPDAA